MSYWALIGTADLQNDAVTTAKIASGAVTSTEIADDTIVNADVNSAAAIAYSKLDLTASIVPGDFDASVTLDDFTAAGTVDMNSNQFSNLPAASSSGQAVEYDQFVGALDGLSYKEPADLATTGNITLSGEQTIDGTLTSASRVLVKDQSTASENGLYISAAGAWSRASDADIAAEVDDGATVWVKSGTANADTRHTQINTINTIGSDNQSWVQTGSATTVNEFSDLSDGNLSAPADGQMLRYEAGAGELQNTANAVLNDNGQLQLDVTGVNGGLRLGGDWSIYRSAAGTATIPSNNLVVGNELTSGSRFTSNGGRQVDTRIISASASLSAFNDHFVRADSNGGAINVTLPSTHNAGTQFHIKRNGSNNVTIVTSDADTIDGAADYVIAIDQRAITVVSDGTNWDIY